MTEFPEGWSDDKIISAIEDVANDPNSENEPGRRNRTFIRGTRNGIDIEIVVSGNSVDTGYPTNTPKIKHNTFNRIRLDQLFEILTPLLPERDIRQVGTLIYVNEWGIALEQLLGAIAEDSLPFPPEAQQLSEGLAAGMEMEDDECLVALRNRNTPPA